MTINIQDLVKLSKTKIDSLSVEEADAFFMAYTEIKQDIAAILKEFDLDPQTTSDSDIKKAMEIFSKGNMLNTMTKNRYSFTLFPSPSEKTFIPPQEGWTQLNMVLGAITTPVNGRVTSQTAAHFYLYYKEHEAVLREKIELIENRLDLLHMKERSSSMSF